MVYVYEAVGKSGRVVSGTAIASSMAELQKDLGAKGMSLIAARRSLLGQFKDLFRAKKLKRAVLIDMFGYLNGLLAMGMDMNKTWASLSESIENPLGKEVIASIRASIDQGFTLSESMDKTGVFEGLVRGNVKAGEEAGQLEKVFAALESHYRAEAELAQQIMKATLYPLISLVVLFMIGVGLLTFVIPQLKETFPAKLPLPTKILVVLSDGAVGYWWTVPLGVVMIIIGWKRLPETQKAAIWELLYKAWVVGSMLKNMALSNLFANLALMLNSGVALTKALDTVVPNITSKALRRRLENVREIISNGGMFSEGFRDPFFPGVVAAALAQGETTGSLDAYLTRVSQFLGDRARARMHVLATFIEPIMLLIGGGMILLLAIGIFLPIYGSMKTMGK